VGRSSLAGTLDGKQNTAIGNWSGAAITSGEDNVACGYASLYTLSSGSQNSALGRDAGRYNSAAGSMNYTQTSSVGAYSRPAGSNTITLGTSSDTTYTKGGTVSTISDQRDKTDIRDASLGLDFINKITPREYRFDMREDYFDYNEETEKLDPVTRDGSRSGTRFHQGVIAQEVKGVMDNLGVDFAGYKDMKINGGDDLLAIEYSAFITPLIKAIQELTARVEQLEGEV
jgi:hypothetical protein